MRQSIAAVFLAAFAAISLSAAELWAAVVPPIGLAPGSQYQLIFVTANPHNAVSTSISVYNSFVNDEAALGVPSGLPASAGWTAVASTSAMDASENAPSGVLPVYNTAGQLVAAAGVGIYMGALDNLVGYDQFGDVATEAQSNNVWTGSDSSGMGIAGATIGGSGSAEVGQLALDGTWLEFDVATIVAEVAYSRPFYALSPAFTVPVPEPATIWLLVSALVLLGGRRVLRQRRSVLR